MLYLKLQINGGSMEKGLIIFILIFTVPLLFAILSYIKNDGRIIFSFILFLVFSCGVIYMLVAMSSALDFFVLKKSYELHILWLIFLIIKGFILILSSSFIFIYIFKTRIK